MKYLKKNFIEQVKSLIYAILLGIVGYGFASFHDKIIEIHFLMTYTYYGVILIVFFFFMYHLYNVLKKGDQESIFKLNYRKPDIKKFYIASLIMFLVSVVGFTYSVFDKSQTGNIIMISALVMLAPSAFAFVILYYEVELDKKRKKSR